MKNIFALIIALFFILEIQAWYSIKVKPGQNPVEVANKIFETGVFAASFPSFSLNALEISYDENIYEQWGLYNSTYKGFDISISKAWSYATGRGIKIAIVDQGIQYRCLLRRRTYCRWTARV